jgi:hypothetical protein
MAADVESAYRRELFYRLGLQLVEPCIESADVSALVFQFCVTHVSDPSSSGARIPAFKFTCRARSPLTGRPAVADMN